MLHPFDNWSLLVRRSFGLALILLDSSYRTLYSSLDAFQSKEQSPLAWHHLFSLPSHVSTDHRFQELTDHAHAGRIDEL